MGCPHCLNNSGPSPHGVNVDMDFRTFQRSLEHAKYNKVNFITLSGGEPTLHPSWHEFCKTALTRAYDFKEVMLITNGTWVGSYKEHVITQLLEEEMNFTVQITCIKGLYTRYDTLVPMLKDYIERLKKRETKPGMLHGRVHLCIDVPIHFVSLGRAADHKEYLEQAAKDWKISTSCFIGAQLSAQMSRGLTYAVAIDILETRGHYCRPRIDYRGGIGWSESSLCPSFANVHDEEATIAAKCRKWRPCGRCPDYQKLLNNPDIRYVQARKILGIKGKDDK